MAALRHLALGCCILCAVAGVIRIFWPENNFKPVINTVLMLYILTSVLRMGSGADWSGLTAELRGWAGSATGADYTSYAQQIGLEASADALTELLARNGIDASVEIRDGICWATLANAADRIRAGEILKQSSGTLPYQILTGDDAL